MVVVELRITLTESRPALVRAGTLTTSPITGEDTLRFGLRILHRLLRRLGTGERRLQPVVESFGDPLVLVRRQLSHGKLQLVAGRRCRRKVGNVLLQGRRL